MKRPTEEALKLLRPCLEEHECTKEMDVIQYDRFQRFILEAIEALELADYQICKAEYPPLSFPLLIEK